MVATSVSRFYAWRVDAPPGYSPPPAVGPPPTQSGSRGRPTVGPNSRWAVGFASIDDIPALYVWDLENPPGEKAEGLILTKSGDPGVVRSLLLTASSSSGTMTTVPYGYGNPERNLIPSIQSRLYPAVTFNTAFRKPATRCSPSARIRCCSATSGKPSKSWRGRSRV